jgi:putative phage-type endonuclease
MQDVTIDRNLYIGGSDIPIIMGISPFKKRFDLLLEKAELKHNEFSGNEYTEYGNILEPKIREFINLKEKKPFLEDKKIVGDIRCHVDGYNQKDTILEIKTTSQVHKSVDEYKLYLCQLLFYMSVYEAKKGKLAVYERPKDFNEEFDEKRLTTYDINFKDYKELVEDILQAVDQFRKDLIKVKENPFITEEELQPKEVIELSNKVVELESKLLVFKELEKQYNNFKNELFNAMEEHNIKSWVTNNGTRITRIDTTKDVIETSQEFNVSKFKEKNLELYNQFLEPKEKVIKKGKKGFVRIKLMEGKNV